MTQECLPAGCVRLMRVWSVDPCTGLAIPGITNGYWIEDIRNVLWNPNIEEGETTILQTDCKKIAWKQTECDDLINYTFELELLNPDYEFQELVTSQPLIVDGGGDTIGIKEVKDVDCHPWVGIELFEEVPDDECVGGFSVRRIVFLKARFGTPTTEKEGQMRTVKYMVKTSTGVSTAYGTGPWEDSAVDFGTSDPDERAHKYEYFDSTIDLDATEGFCGYTEVPVPA